MKSNIKLFLFFITITFLLTACRLFEPSRNNEENNMMPLESNLNQRVALVVAPQGFQDLEYENTKKVLEAGGLEIVTVSSQGNEAQGKFGQIVKIERNLFDLDPNRFGALVFIGGPGAVDYIEDQEVHQVVHQFVEKDKVLGAICLAPVILAQAEVLAGHQATVWSDPDNQWTIEALKEKEAEYVDQAVVIDSRIVTANGPLAAERFGQALVDLLLP
ncbi:DJ-1/PfpI family protein [Patescibacteria group bacterium]|nr:DJ-1/PfpI family protein [Patescibacteria group bacterium]